MNDMQNMKIKINKKYLEIYHTLPESWALQSSVAKGYASLFVLCVCLGFRDYLTSGVVAEAFEEADLMMFRDMSEHQQTVLQVIAIKAKNDYQILQFPEKIITLAERFAERGMQILLDQVFNVNAKEACSGEAPVNILVGRGLEKKLGLFIQEQLFKNLPLF